MHSDCMCLCVSACVGVCLSCIVIVCGCLCVSVLVHVSECDYDAKERKKDVHISKQKSDCQYD